MEQWQAHRKQALVGRVTPCAPLPIPKGGARGLPPYHYCNRMRLTACRSVSCYGGSAGRIALVGRVLEYWPPQADGRASSQAGRFLLKK
jgi:hypothetical protein